MHLQLRVKSIDWYNANKDEYGDVWFNDGKYVFTPQMSAFCGKEITIIGVRFNFDSEEVWYVAEEDKGVWMWRYEMFDCLTIQPASN